MNKKGFTLIEIIVCIVLIVAIGTLSFIGINAVLKNNRVSKLNDIKDEIMIAAKIYLETNDAAQSQLYTKGNAVVVPLNVLVNEGLLDLSTTELDMDDIKDEYVLTGRTTTVSESDGCVNITSTASWNMSDENPLFICTKSDGSIVLSGDAGISDNLGATKRAIYYLGYTENNAYYDDINNTYKILYIDTDDSIILGKTTSFGDVFNGKTSSFLKIKDTQEISGISCSSSNVKQVSAYKKIYSESEIIVGEASFDSNDIRFFMCNNWDVYFLGEYATLSSYLNILNFKKIKLKPCMKITEGNGTTSNPYKIEDKC